MVEQDVTPTTLIQNLKEAAGKATPGPWQCGFNETEHHYSVDKLYADCGVCVTKLHKAEDARYIALANPQNILLLLGEIERLQDIEITLSSEIERLEEIEGKYKALCK